MYIYVGLCKLMLHLEQGRRNPPTPGESHLRPAEMGSHLPVPHSPLPAPAPRAGGRGGAGPRQTMGEPHNEPSAAFHIARLHTAPPRPPQNHSGKGVGPRIPLPKKKKIFRWMEIKKKGKE